MGVQPIDTDFKGPLPKDTVGLLLERKLIEECGRLQVPGRPRLYRTTQTFLRSFHLRSLEDLPPLPGVDDEEGQMRMTGEEADEETGGAAT